MSCCLCECNSQDNKDLFDDDYIKSINNDDSLPFGIKKIMCSRTPVLLETVQYQEYNILHTVEYNDDPTYYASLFYELVRQVNVSDYIDTSLSFFIYDKSYQAASPNIFKFMTPAIFIDSFSERNPLSNDKIIKRYAYCTDPSLLPKPDSFYRSVYFYGYPIKIGGVYFNHVFVHSHRGANKNIYYGFFAILLGAKKSKFEFYSDTYLKYSPSYANNLFYANLPKRANNLEGELVKKRYVPPSLKSQNPPRQPIYTPKPRHLRSLAAVQGYMKLYHPTKEIYSNGLIKGVAISKDCKLV